MCLIMWNKKFILLTSIQVIFQWSATEISHLLLIFWSGFASILTCSIFFLQHSTMIKVMSLNISSYNLQEFLSKNFITQLYLKNGRWILMKQNLIFKMALENHNCKKKSIVITVELTGHPILLAKFSGFASRIWSHM